MSINPLISIIIPTFNRVHIVSETLDSVIAQTYGNWECIIVDDGSTDETERLIGAYCEKDSRFQYHHRPENRSKGANACRNYGFELSKGEYVLFLDSDDLLKDTCLELRLDTFKKDDNLDFVIGNTSFYKNAVFSEIPLSKSLENKTSKEFLNMFLSYNLPWTIFGVLWKRNTITDVCFNEGLNRFQDIDFHIKVLLSKELRSLRLQQVDVFYRVDALKSYSKKSVDVVLSALVKFNNIHKNLIQESQYKNGLRVFNAKIIFEYAIPYFYQNKKTANSLFLSLMNSKMYNPMQRLNFGILFFLLNTGLFKIKGIGIYRFTSYLSHNLLSK